MALSFFSSSDKAETNVFSLSFFFFFSDKAETNVFGQQQMTQKTPFIIREKELATDKKISIISP